MIMIMSCGLGAEKYEIRSFDRIEVVIVIMLVVNICPGRRGFGIGLRGLWRS